jgi:hypothetical protein
MNGIAVIQSALAGTRQVFEAYFKDLSDADLFLRPVPGANHLAWQLGHLIHSEVLLVKSELPEAAYPALPAGFAEAHTRDTAGKDGPGNGFLTKEQYLSLFAAVRAATTKTVAGLSDADLDRPSVGVMKGFAPRLGDLLLLVSNHTLMHGGQVTVVRRKLGKPVLF